MKITAWLNNAFVARSRSQTMVSQQSGPGFLVFSHSRQLQYVNRRALELVGNIGQVVIESCLTTLPSQLLKLHDQIHEGLDRRLKANLWEPFEESRVVTECGRKLLLRGFGYPDRTASEHSHIVILLELFAEQDKSYRLPSTMIMPERQTAGVGLLANS